MAKSYRPVDRGQQFLLPPDMASWLAADHLIWFLIDVVAELDMSKFEAKSRRGGVGRQAFDPRMLLTVLIYAYATGQRSSRRIEDLCGTDVAFRVLCAQDVPDHTTIARFRQRHQEAVADLFVQVLTLAGRAGLGRVGVVAIDGTKIAANASVGANRKRSWLRGQVDQMMAEADQADVAEDELFGADVSGTELDPGWADRATRKERIKAALRAADESARKAAKPDADKAKGHLAKIEAAERHLKAERAKAQERFNRFKAKTERAQREGTGKPTGVYPRSAEDYRSVAAAKSRLAKRQKRRGEAAAQAAQRATERKEPRANTTDPDCGPMPTADGWIQGYNAQLAVSDDQLILAAQATDAPGDCEQLTPMIEAAQTGIEALNNGRSDTDEAPRQIGTVVADAGYLSEKNLSAPGPDRLIATGKRYELEKAANHPGHQPEPADDSEPSNLAEAMAKRLRTDEAMTTYRRRGITVEPVNGHLKDRIGLRQFSRRGIKAVQAELLLAATVANLLKIHRYGH